MQTQETIDTVSQDVRAILGDIEYDVLTEGITLASLMREGASVSNQAFSWSDLDGGVCALSAAEAALRARK